MTGRWQTPWFCIFLKAFASIPQERDRTMIPILMLALALGADPVEADVILQGGTIFDGSGQPGVVADVAIKGERIVALGKFTVAGQPKIIDCTGLYIAAGFIDLHTHSDDALTQPGTKYNRNYQRQGVTLVITGNCGAGPVDAAGYFARMEKGGIGTNVIHQVPHNNLRAQVMGNVNRAPTANELTAMEKLVDKAMSDGDWGLSTGLIYNPGIYCKTEEIIALAKVAAKHGGVYASHIRGEGAEVLTSIEEALRIGREAGLPVHISHLKASGRPNWGKSGDIVALIEKARKDGQVVTADQYPYVASSTSLRATLVPARFREGSQQDFLLRLNDREQLQKLSEAIEAELKHMRDGADIRIARYTPKPQFQGKDLVTIANMEGKSPLDIVLEIERNGGAQIVHFSMSDDDMRFIMKQPWVATASDGGAMIPSTTFPHPRSYGCFPRKIGRFAIGEQSLPVEQAIRSASGLPADILRLTDRGYVKKDYFADIVVFEPKTYRDTATFDKPHQYATGVKWLFVNGQAAIADGADTKVLAGKVLRHKDP
jgi:N-acyl-D-amino-acid deacylase